MNPPQIRADFTVKGANAASLVDEARRQADALAGVGYQAEVVSLAVQADSRATQPGQFTMGEVTGWRAEVEARLRPEPRGDVEEPF